jgi:Flp pilus assembly pilin Flp
MLRSMPGEKGQSLVETALLIMLIALVVLGAVAAFGEELLDIYQYIFDNFPKIV